MASRRTTSAMVGAAVLLVLVGAGVFWFLSGDAPDEVDLDQASSAARDRDTTTGEQEGDGSAPEVEGTWSVDRDTGGFDYESASGSFVGFRVQEELVGIGGATAVGRTGEVAGSMTIESSMVTDASFEVDMTSLTTNDPRRDDRVREALRTEEHPTATFVLAEPIELLGPETERDLVTADATGELTINGISRNVVIPVQARVVGDTIVVVGSTDVVFADYGVEVPSAPIVVSAEDRGILEMQLLFVRSQD